MATASLCPAEGGAQWADPWGPPAAPWAGRGQGNVPRAAGLCMEQGVGAVAVPRSLRPGLGASGSPELLGYSSGPSPAPREWTSGGTCGAPCQARLPAPTELRSHPVSGRSCPATRPTSRRTPPLLFCHRCYGGDRGTPAVPAPKGVSASWCPGPGSVQASGSPQRLLLACVGPGRPSCSAGPGLDLCCQRVFMDSPSALCLGSAGLGLSGQQLGP